MHGSWNQAALKVPIMARSLVHLLESSGLILGEGSKARASLIHMIPELASLA